MANIQGDWIWYELMTTDAEAAQAFYGKVIGWSFKKAEGGNPDLDYRGIVADDGEHAGGILPLTKAMCDEGARPGWLGYIAVDDVDIAVASIAKAGGSVIIPASDIPGIGRFAMLTDPAGAVFYVMRGAMDDHTSTVFAKHAPRNGHCAWNELATSDQNGALAFYKEQFGWTQDGAMDMGAMGSYAFLRHDNVMIGAITPKPPQMAQSAWTFYFRVADIAKAEAAIRESGGTVLHGPHPVPGDDMIIIGLDPQDASFAIVGKKP